MSYVWKGAHPDSRGEWVSVSVISSESNKLLVDKVFSNKLSPVVLQFASHLQNVVELRARLFFKPTYSVKEQ